MCNVLLRSWWQSPEFQSAHKDQVATVKLRGNKFLRNMMGKQLVDETKRVMEFQAKSQVLIFLTCSFDFLR